MTIPVIQTEGLSKRFGSLEALVPAADFRWGAALWLTGPGLAAIGLGAFFFTRRDLAGL